MHIPNAMLNGAICPVTAVMSVIGVAIAALQAFWSEHKPSAAKFGAVTALIFAGQMMNYKIQIGTSGHLIGGILAVALLGLPMGVLSIALVVTIQCLVFSDGGFTVLGANILNMSLIGTALAGFIYSHFSKKFTEKSGKYFTVLGLASWLSVMMAALACSIELGISGTISLSKVLGAMLGSHALIGIGEAIITIAVCWAFSLQEADTSEKTSVAIPLAASGIIAVILSPFASSYPDGLEWVAEKYSFLHEAAPSFASPLPDYTMTAVSNEILTTAIAGFIGVVVTFLISWVVAKLLSKQGSLNAV